MAYITQKKKPSLPKNDFETLARQNIPCSDLNNHHY
ncbi:hypothetical protein DERF_008308 [Dermatophagoides farinae]|uniref:Uncharacterized protein n=1 Tax=Dermatophagoides farinae TaxID=6954 RepID=A0A922L5C6_DERFA|nr:hypothetical protein DERF_008308 [Dermatophagoides farinae]